MKKVIVFLVLLYNSVMLIAQIGSIPFALGEFPIDLYQYPHMILIDNPESVHLDTVYSFTNTERNYQIRYTFFRQTNRDDPNIRTPFAVMMVPIIWNIAGREVTNVNNFNDMEVGLAFNGDFGATIFIENPRSDFTEGFDYILLNFFYKNNQGFIVQSIFSNDPHFFTFENIVFSDIFHSFRFRD